MKHVSTAIVMASISALAQQAHAASEINIDTSLVSADLSVEIRKVFENEYVSSSIRHYSPLIGKQLTIDGNPSEIQLDKLTNIASLQRQSRKGDTTGVRSDTSIDSVCYGNCHSACHGSRSWR